MFFSSLSLFLTTPTLYCSLKVGLQSGSNPRAVAFYNGNLDRNPSITNLRTSSNPGFPPVLTCAIAKTIAVVEVPRNCHTRVAVEQPTLCPSMVSPLLKLGVFDRDFRYVLHIIRRIPKAKQALEPAAHRHDKTAKPR